MNRQAPLGDLFRQAGIHDRTGRLGFFGAVAGRELASPSELTSGEVALARRVLVAGIGEDKREVPR